MTRQGPKGPKNLRYTLYARPGLPPGCYRATIDDVMPDVSPDGASYRVFAHVDETPAPLPAPAPPQPLNLAPLDRGVRLVRHLNTRYDEDPELPFKVEVILAAPSFMAMAFVSIYGGTEDIVAQAVDLASLRDFVVRNNLTTYSRFRRLTATGPDDFRVELTSTDIARRRAAVG